MLFEQASTVNEIVLTEIFGIDGHSIFPYHAFSDKYLHHDNFSLLD